MIRKRWTLKRMFVMMAVGLSMISLAVVEKATSSFAEDPPSLQQQIEELQKGQQAIRDELKEIKKLLTAPPKRPSPVDDIDVTLDLGASPAKGQTKAPLTLVEFTDYQCPFCARHSKTVLPQLVKNFIDTGKVRYVLRDFPLTSIHPFAAKAHEAALCAGEQGKYWDMHDQLFANQKALQAEKLVGYAKEVGVTDLTAFQACLDSAKYETQAKTGVMEGTKIGVRGTPSFALGRTEPDGTVKAVKLIRGAQGLPAFTTEIQALLDGKAEQPARD